MRITRSTLEKIAKIFIGDEEDLFSYKSNGVISKFFEERFGLRDDTTFKPSRWLRAANFLITIYNANKLGSFFDVVLASKFLAKELDITDFDALSRQNRYIARFNEILKDDDVKLIKKAGKMLVLKIEEDLQPLGSGGFADVFYIPSKKLVVKKLKDENANNKGVKSRFKREFEITKSLSDLAGVIKVYDFCESDYSYTMERAEQTLRDYITSSLSEEVRLRCIQQILEVMQSVHGRKIIHRDLSPTNIFILGGMLKIADFGLGKDFSKEHSHETDSTKGYGQYAYCAPEQYRGLKDGDERSDIFSIGRIINFMLTRDPHNSKHFLISVVQKATADDSMYRHPTISALAAHIKTVYDIYKNGTLRDRVKNKIETILYDAEVEMYLHQLSVDNAVELIRYKNFSAALATFMRVSGDNAQEVMTVMNSMMGERLIWEDYDKIAFFATGIIIDDKNMPYHIRETAAEIISHVAWSVGRYVIQGWVRSNIVKLEPTLQGILREPNHD